MAFKYVALFAFVATVAAVELQHAVYQPVLHKTLVKQVEYEAPAEYSFEYGVHDGHTGDVKSQKEVRHGDNVEGHYSLIDADGYKRVVHYSADEHNGFQAKVEREYVGGHYEAPKQVKYVSAPVVQKYVAAPVVHAAPVVQKYVQAPVYQKVAYAAPVAYAHHDNHATVSVQSHGANYHY